MRDQLAKDIVESTFRQKVSDLITQTKSLTINNALQLVIDFFNNYEIKNVDTSVPDNDMLLFEYGIYDWQDGNGENYTIGITRQFYVENGLSDGFSQLHLTLYFNCEEYKQIE